MSWILYTCILLATFILMEGITWATHKYIMHGLLWNLHEDHHQPQPGFFEKNDAFFVIFAIPSFCFILFGTHRQDILVAGNRIWDYGLWVCLLYCS